MVFDIGSISHGEYAVNVLGQSNFTDYSWSCTRAGLGSPGPLAVDSVNRKLWVADLWYHRVTVFEVNAPVDGENASDVLGQTGASRYTQASPNNGVKARGFDEPEGLALNAHGHRLFVADSWNYRVLVFNLTSDNQVASHTPSYVLGTKGFTNDPPLHQPTVATDSNLNFPMALAFDEINNRLFVADSLNTSSSWSSLRKRALRS
jgi:DNA-binding beta-propeller fold protein YncE